MSEFRRTTRRGFLRLAGAGGMGLLLAACGPQAAPTASAPSGAKATDAPKSTAAPQATAPQPTPTMELSRLGSGKTEIQFWINWSGVWREAMLGVTNMFLEKNPDHTVNVLTATPDKIMTAIAGGNPPDVFTTNSTVSYAARGAVMPIDDLLVSSTIKESDFLESSWLTATWRGKKYGVPCIDWGAISCLLWNKELFEKAGLDPEKPPLTPTELRDFADKLFEVDNAGNLKTVGFDPRDSQGGAFWHWAMMWDIPLRPNIWDPENEQIYINKPFMVEALKYIKGYYDKWGADKFAAYRQTYTMWTGNPQSGFVQGRQAMLLNGSYAFGEIKRYNPDLLPKIGFTWMPNANGKKLQDVGGWDLDIPKGSKNPQSGIKLAEAFSTIEAHDFMRKTCGSFGALKAYFEQGDFSDLAGLKWYVESVSKADRVESRNLGPVGAELNTKWQALRDDVIYNKITPEEGLPRLEKEVQDSLAEVLKFAPK